MSEQDKELLRAWKRIAENGHPNDVLRVTRGQIARVVALAEKANGS